jgi:hypothetical protein
MVELARHNTGEQEVRRSGINYFFEKILLFSLSPEAFATVVDHVIPSTDRRSQNPTRYRTEIPRPGASMPQLMPR